MGNYFKIALRKIRRQKAFSFINVAGLAVGLAPCLLILLWVKDELGYDTYHEKADRVYRLTQLESFGGPPARLAVTPFVAAPAFASEIPEVETYARLLAAAPMAVDEGRRFDLSGVFYTDPGFFDIFSHAVMAGDLATALDGPGSLVLTKETALKPFGRTDVVGSTVNFGGVGGMKEPHTFVMEPENDIHSVLVRGWVEKLCREAIRQGFKAVIVLTGHYGAAQQMVVRDLAVRLSRSLGVPVLGTPEYFLALDVGYRGDHAAWGETSLMLYLDPESVDLTQLGNPPHQGVGGRDPREATRADGEKLAEVIISRLVRLAQRMPKWDRATLDKFIEAEAALVNRQLALASSEKLIWAGWRNIGKGALSDYGRLLAEEKFGEIANLTREL